MELNVGLIAGPIYNELYQRLDVFTSETGIHVNIVLHEPQHTLNASLLDNYASREPAMPLDLITCHSKYAPSQSHFLLPLDDLLDPEEIRAFTPAMIEFARVGGQLVQLPRNCDVKLLMYRRDVLESPGVWGSSRAKIEVPSSWEACRSVAAELANVDEGLSGFVFTGRLSGLFGTFYDLLLSAGGEFMDDSGSPRFNSVEGRWALSQLTDIYRRAAVSEMVDYSFDDVAKSFAEGRVAMYTEWPGYWSYLTSPKTSSVWDRVGVAAYPSGPTRRCSYTGSHSFAIPTSANDKSASLELLRFLVSDDSLMIEARSGSLVPKYSVMDAVEAETLDGSAGAERWRLLRETMEHHALLPPRRVDWPAVEDALWPALRDGYTGRIPIEQALSDASHRVREALVKSGGQRP